MNNALNIILQPFHLRHKQPPSSSGNVLHFSFSFL